MSPQDPVWDELGKVDYLLDQLARAVERGEMARDAWDRLSPRYYERRAELAAVLASRAARVAPVPSPAASVPAGTPAAVPASAPVTAGAVPLPIAAAPHAVPAAGPRPSAPAAHRPSAGAWMAYAGALLVVVAVAIFTVYAWATFSPLLKLGVLVAVTAFFYGAGELVRVKLDLPAVGVALVSVGSAMLLFDGWSVIRATGATGPWPWAVVLLVCSVVYWLTELRITGGWFGAIGAAAQIGWWWMLGSALGWEPYWVAAGVSGVAAAWAFASDRADPAGPLATLARILRAGAVIVAAGAGVSSVATGIAAQTVGAPTYWPVAAAAVTAVAITLVVERLAPRPRGISSIGHAPLFIAGAVYWVALLLDGSGPTLALVLTALAMAVVYDIYALWRGSGLYALAGLAAESAFWLLLAQRYHWRGEVTVGVLLAFGVTALVASRVVEGVSLDPDRWSGATWAARVWGYGGVAILVMGTLLVPMVGNVPLSGASIGARAALLALGALAAWVIACAVRRSPTAGRVAFAWSFYTLAAAVAWTFPGWHSAWYGACLLALAAVLSQGRGLVQRALRIPPEEVAVWCRVIYGVVVAVALAGSATFFALDAYPVAALLGIACLVWVAEGWRSGARWALAPSAASFVASVGVAAWTARDLGTAAAFAGAASVVPAAAGLVGPRKADSWGAYAAAGGAVMGAILAFAAPTGGWRLAAALLFVACAWALTTGVTGQMALAAVAAGFGSFALLAALAWRDMPSAYTVAALGLYAGVLLAPRALARAAVDSRRLPLARALAGAGALAITEAVLLGVAARALGTGPGPGGWTALGETELALALALAGGFTITWTAIERLEAGLYPGIALIVTGAMVQMDAWDLRDAEWFLVLAALYFAGMGVLWASRTAGRRVPVGTDVAAFAVGVATPLVLAVGAYPAEDALRHGLWALGLSAVSVAVGLLARTRVYFQGGIVVLVLDALWLSRTVLLALPSWVWIGSIGLALIAGGVVYARRQSLEGVGHRIREGFSGWR